MWWFGGWLRLSDLDAYVLLCVCALPSVRARLAIVLNSDCETNYIQILETHREYLNVYTSQCRRTRRT